MIAAAYGVNSSNMEDRSHPNLQTLDALTLSYPGFERDKREAEAVHWGSSDSSLSFDAAIRRLKVKQRAYEEQRSTKAIYRSHPNLVSLDSLELSYPDWEEDFKKAEEAHNNDPNNCGFIDILRKLQVKQLRFENDRSHYRLREIDSLKLSYPGWMKDIRSLEKFHFEEAFFLPGDSVFQSKLDGLKRRQQIYVRSTKLRANRLGLNCWADPSESEEISTGNTQPKGSYAILIGSGSHQRPNKPKPTALDPEESDPHQDVSSASLSLFGEEQHHDDEEERSDRQSTCSSRTPYAVVIDADAISVHLAASDSGRTPSDPPNNPRPDPPEECNDVTDQSIQRIRTTSRARIDGGGSLGSAAENSHGGIDCEEQVSVRDQNSNTSETKSDPIGICEPSPPDSPSTHQQHQHQQQASRPSPSKLSSYIDLGPAQVNNAEDSDGGASEGEDQVPALPNTRYSASSRSVTSNKSRSSHHSHHRSRKVNRPKGIYSAPQLPLDDDELSNVSRTYSAGTSSSQAVTRDDRSTAFSSQCSTMAVWSEDQSVASASSSRAVWAESPTPYENTKYSMGGTTPLSIKTAHSMPADTHGQHLRIPSSSQRSRGSSRGAVSEHPRTRGAVSEHQGIRSVASEQQPRTRKMRGEKSSRVSRSSRASSSNGTSTSGRSKKLGRCTICGDADKNHVFVPCGHLCACKGCAAQVITRQMKCPVCRGGVTEAIQVFL